MKIMAEPNGNVHIHLRDVEVAIERRGEIVVDLNLEGHWIRGFEVIGGMMDFSLKIATSPFLSAKPGGLTVTYDNEADAAYFGIRYGSRFAKLSQQERQFAETYSYSVNPTGLYRFDVRGGMVSVVIPTADLVRNVEDFLFFFDYQLLDAAATRP